MHNKKENKMKFILWDDMFRGWSNYDLDKLKINGKNVIEPCIWNYSGDKKMFDSIAGE